MTVRIEIYDLQAGANGALCFDDGSMFPLNIPADSYEQLIERGFFVEPPAGLPLDDQPINRSIIMRGSMEETLLEDDYNENYSEPETRLPI